MEAKNSGLRTPASAPYWSWDTATACVRTGSSLSGLGSSEARARLPKEARAMSRASGAVGDLRLLGRQFESPLVLILLFASTVAAVVHEWTEASIILVIVAGSTLLGFAQEWRASRALAALHARLALKTRVLRDGVVVEAPASEIVRGDVIVLSAGNLAPADGVIISSRDFLVTEASLTGESFPVEKMVGVLAPTTPLPQRSNCVLAGASVRSGEARVLVVETGKTTVIGAVAAGLQAHAPETEFQKGLRRFGYLLLRVVVVLVLFVLIINQALGRPFLESLLFSVALAVGLSPELLPAIVSVTLAAGARRMARRGVLVRHLEAIENLGGIDLLCTDKTGTLTQGCASLSEALDADGVVSARVMALALANSSLETGIENPLDQAVVAAGNAAGLSVTWQKLDEIPYDFQRKRLTIVVDDGDDESALIISKGAFREIIDICAIDSGKKRAAEALFQTYSEAGLRVLGVATRRMPRVQRYARSDECDMHFEGFLKFEDPIKSDAKAALEAMMSAGVGVKIVTGDNRYVAAHVAEAMGIDPHMLITGEQLEEIAPDALAPLAERANVFAEIDPQQKQRIVTALQRRGHAVGFLGDGVNDAPSLHAADVGISVEGGVDVAREAADIILLERDLGVLKQGIEDGRRTFANTLKYICITTGSSFGNMVSMAAATLVLPFLPMTAAQVLLTNVLTDLPLMAIATDNVDAERTGRPLRWRVGQIQSFMLVFGLLSSVFDVLTFWFLRQVWHVGEHMFQTLWFVISVLTEVAAILVLRTQRQSWKSAPSRWILAISAAVAAVTVAAPFVGPFATWFLLTPPSVWLVAAAFAIALGYALSTEAAKYWYYRRHA
jgi:Mg2+-importing ATPase